MKRTWTILSRTAASLLAVAALSVLRAEQSRFSAVRGKVVDEAGRPVANANVAFDPLCAWAGALRTAISDDRGQFSVGLPACTYVPVASKIVPAYLGFSFGAIFSEPGQPVVEVHPPQDISGIVVRLTRAGWLGGAVFDCTTGLPVPGAQIVVVRADDPRMWTRETPTRAGGFRIAVPIRQIIVQVKAGRYEPWQYPPLSSNEKSFSVARDQRRTLVARLQPLGKECPKGPSSR